MGGKRKLAALRQPLTERSHKACAARRVAGDFKVKGGETLKDWWMINKPYSFVIPVKTGIQFDF